MKNFHMKMNNSISVTSIQLLRSMIYFKKILNVEITYFSFCH